MKTRNGGKSEVAYLQTSAPKKPIPITTNNVYRAFSTLCDFPTPLRNDDLNTQTNKWSETSLTSVNRSLFS